VTGAATLRILRIAPMRFASLAGVTGLFAPLLLTACTTVSRIRGPANEPAYVVRCSQSESCFAKATELCPDGYTLQTSGKNTSGYVIRGNGSVSTRTEIMFSCEADMPAPASGKSKAATAPREDTLVCEAAFGRAMELGAYWAKSTPGSHLLDEPPTKPDFVAVCREMPEHVRRCLHSKYREAHEKSCDAVLMRLDSYHRAKIDGLYLQAPEPGAKDGAKRESGANAL
jgi:hypothetical protein